MVRNILFFVVVFLTNIIQCVTGFAGTVLAMPFSVLLVGYDTARPILNALGRDARGHGGGALAQALFHRQPDAAV